MATHPNRPPKAKSLPDHVLTTHRTMRQLMVQGREDPVVRQLVARVVSDAVGHRDLYEDESAYMRARCRAVWQWVRDNIAYINDGWDSALALPDEVLRDVENILRDKAGDCDDHTILVGSMLLAGFEGPTVNGRMVSPVEVYMWGAGNVPTHIFPVAVMPDGKKYSMDTTVPPGAGFNSLPLDGIFWPCEFFGPHFARKSDVE